MKKIIGLIVSIILIMGSTLIIHANPQPETDWMTVQVRTGYETKTTNVHLANLQGKMTYNIIKNVKGRDLFSENKGGKEGYAEKFDIHEMLEKKNLMAITCFKTSERGF